MVSEVASFFEWLIANRQNRVEWVLLWDTAMGEYAVSKDRQAKLKALNNLAHEWGLTVGGDVPIAEIQQHAW